MGGKNSTTSKKEVSFTVCTWNLGNETPTSGFGWIGPERESDVYALGFQEAVYEKRDGFITTEQDLFLSIHRTLGEDKYDVIDCQSLTPRTDKTYKTQASFKDAIASGAAKESGIRMIVLVKRSLIKEGWWPADTDMTIQTCGRLGGVSGNKGGIGLSMRVGETWISFLSAHMAAHTHENEKRIEDYGTIMGGLHPPEEGIVTKLLYTTLEQEDPTKSLFEQSYVRNVEMMNRSHVVFAMGDFNFRLEPLKEDGTPVPSPDDLKEVQEDYELRQWESMAGYDQLKREQTKGRAFHGFQECDPGYPRFMPTFKLHKASAEKDKDTYNPKRVPSWCDRVLWRTVGPLVSCGGYHSHPNYQPNTSDHTPVSATFTVECVKGGHTLAREMSKLLRFSSMSAKPAKKRELILSKFTYKPNVEHISVLFDGDIEKAKAAMSGVELTVSAWHPCLDERMTTEDVKWSEDTMKWKNQLHLTSKFSLEQIALSPFVVYIRNKSSQIKTLHCFGEAMLDLRTLRGQVDGKSSKNTFSVELYQRGTPRGTLSGEFQMMHC